MLVIYLEPVLPQASIVLPSSSDGPPSLLFAGIHELSTPGMHSIDVTTNLVGSYPAFSPLPSLRRRLFSSAFTDPCESLSVRKRDALCCPDFPLVYSSAEPNGSGILSTSDKPFNCFPAAKLNNIFKMRKWFLSLFLRENRRTRKQNYKLLIITIRMG